MFDDGSKGFSIPWPTVMTLAAAVGGALLYFQPLKSARPTALGRAESGSLGLQDAPARLWQDPFKAVADSAEAARKASGAAESPPANPLISIIAGLGKCLGSPADSPAAERHKAGEIETAIEARGQRDLGEILVLGVMMPGGAYAELAEQRLRARQAVLEGLARCGLETENGDHVGWFKVPWAYAMDPASREIPPTAEKLKSLALDSTSLVVPYEWCRTTSMPMAGTASLVARDRSFKHVLVLWVNEDAVADWPAARLGDLLSRINAWHRRPAHVSVKIIGPRVSGTLRAMVSEAKKFPSVSPHPKPLDGIEMYSATATAEDDLLLANFDGSGRWSTDSYGPTQVSKLFDQRLGLKLAYSTHTDAQFAAELADELRLRIEPVNPSADKSANKTEECPKPEDAEKKRFASPTTKPFDDQLGAIALISEWDTFYGRALPLSVARRLSDTKWLSPQVKDAATAQQGFGPWPAYIHTRVYLRGLDGKTPPPPGTPPPVQGQQNPYNAADNQTVKIATPAEATEGVDQSDYLRRLADDLAKLDDRLFREYGERLRAVGVLGTDVYDKLLVLRAIRDKLPHVQVFTTGLDARYALPTEWAAAHNLITVSTYGLKLHDFYQGGVPPFRDSNQTAVFAATLAAARGLSGLATAGKGTDADLLPPLIGKPRRFEIGRRGPYDLSIELEKKEPAGETPEAKAAREQKDTEQKGIVTTIRPDMLQPSRTHISAIQYFRPGVVWGIIFVLMLFGSAVALGVRPERIVWKRVRWDAGSLLGGVIILLVLLWASMWDGVGGRTGQPVTFVDGISVWPCTLIRGWVIVLCIYFAARTSVDVKQNDVEVQEWFSLKGVDNRTPADSVFSAASEMKRTWWKKCIAYSGWPVYGQPVIEECREAWRHVGEEKGHEPQTRVIAQELWWEYQQHAVWWRRFCRAGLFCMLYLAAAVVISDSLCGWPLSPARGYWTTFAEKLTLGIVVIASTFVLFLVIDLAYISRRFIRYLVRTDTHWGGETVKTFQERANRECTLEQDDLVEYLDIRLIALRTRGIGAAVYYPFLIFLLLVIARNSYFGNYSWPTVLIVVMGMNLLLATIAATVLRRAAEDARSDALNKLFGRHLHAVSCGDKDKPRASAIEKLIAEVKNERQGAFSVLSQYPTLAAILLPTGSVGIWILIEQWARSIG